MASSSPVIDKENEISLICRDNGKDGLTLRSYQLEGVKWLINTWKRGSGDGGLLCDDMGLGKTCQVIHLLKYVHSVSGAKKPSIVIVPVSVFKNWQDEFKMWAPKLDLRVYAGSKEERPMMQEEINADLRDSSSPCSMVLLCTPELMINDEEFFASLSYATVIFDEAQRVKNSESILYRICKSLRHHTCILMTGTPVQNNVRELYALLSLAAPVKFPSSNTDSFIYRYADLVSDATLQRQLQTEIAPFMLRRLKSDVEPNLPSRGVVHLYVTLTDLQKKLYRSILAKNIEALTGGIKNSRNNVQNALVSLRKCVDHPYLFDGVEPEPFEAGEHLVTASGKLIVFDRLLSFLKPLGHRVLVFSQMTRMLDIIQDYLTYRNYLYERLDGSVRGEERYLAISNFSRKGGDNVPFVFLLSTKAGGVGLNLVSADTVILFDSDLNPQNDLQAIARAHRIGQTKAVKVIRFVSRFTVEENILRRQSAKICLSEAVVGGAASTATTQPLPGFESQTWWKEVLRIGLDKLFGDNKADESAFDFDQILGKTTKDGCWSSGDEVAVPDAMMAAAEAEKETGDLTTEDLTAPLVETLQLEAVQIRKSETAKNSQKFVDLLPEGKRRTKKTEFLADEMLAEEAVPESKPRKPPGPKIDPAIKRAQAKEKLWQRLDYKSCNLALPEVEIVRNVVDLDENEESDEDTVDIRRGGFSAGIRFVVGDVTKPDEHVKVLNSKRNHCIVCAWVDDCGSWGSGGVFTAIDNAFGNKPAQAYEIASEAKDLNVGDLHLIENVVDSDPDFQVSCAFLVCQHRKPSGDQKPIELANIETVFKRLRCYLDEKKTDDQVTYSIHLPRLGRGPLAARWYGVERLVRKWFCHGPATPFVYYFSRGRAPHSTTPVAAVAEDDESINDVPVVSAGIFSNLKFCLNYLPEGCRVLQHIEDTIKRFGGQIVAKYEQNDDSSHFYFIVDRSDISQDNLDEIQAFSSANCVHYAWIYGCEKKNQLADISAFKL